MQHREATFVSFCTVHDGTNDNRAVVGLIVPFILGSPTGQMASWLVSSKSNFLLKEKRKRSDNKLTSLF